ncbi:MAG: TetR family transcriptional regulator C-terminal domain-containing protein [Weeksellaceae bacterium]|nr:TetR family transcriptional regulator C-terminal domain-containing protein [Weeksellaceae bacterium]
METDLNKEQILDLYMKDKLHGEKLNNVYVFAERHNFAENEFYQEFSNLESIEKYFFELIMQRSVSTLQESEEYHTYSPKDKWLSFYYTFFENLNLNRSFALEIIDKNNPIHLRKLAGLRREFMELARAIGWEKMDIPQKEISKAQDKLIEESAWAHFIFILEFWLRDNSPGFQKTDQLIEKTVQTKYKLIENDALKNVTDLGKFLAKEFSPFK